jgi:hypothetical protein
VRKVTAAPLPPTDNEVAEHFLEAVLPARGESHDGHF